MKEAGNLIITILRRTFFYYFYTFITFVIKKWYKSPFVDCAVKDIPPIIITLAELDSDAESSDNEESNDRNAF